MRRQGKRICPPLTGGVSLPGRHLPGTPASKQLPAHPRARLLLYMTGHGGDQFLKFQDVSEVTTDDLRRALAAARRAHRHSAGMVVADTCQVRRCEAPQPPRGRGAAATGGSQSRTACVARAARGARLAAPTNARRRAR